MTLNVDKQEFMNKWTETGNENEYTNGSLVGTIIYEDDYYFVIKLK
jgi:hypothetical protein